MDRVIFHIDMDAFFASVEQRDQEDYRGKPLIVGAPPDQRGVVCAASYEARKFGVRSAMPSRTAAKLCPQGIFVRPRIARYREESGQIMAILRELSPLIEQVSVDEAYLDVSARCDAREIDDRLRQAVPLAKTLKARILNQRGLTASIGLATNKFLAKLGSDFNKPDGLTLIPERDKVPFLRPLSLGAIPGVGPVTRQSLAKFGLHTIADLQDTHLNLGPAVGSFASTLKQLAFGQDERPLSTNEERKSISSEITFLQDTEHRPTLRAALRELAADVAATLEAEGLGGLTVQVKVRYSDFRTLTRQIRVSEALTSAAEIYRMACHLLATHKLVNGPVRLIGIGASTLVPPSPQLRLPLAP
jgi:DNA polymerase-4